MNFIKKNGLGIIVCLMIAIPSWFLEKALPLLGGAVIAILIGMAVTLIWTNKGKASFGIAFTSKYILQAAVVLLGFGMNLSVVAETGIQSLPIIICTITTSLVITWIMDKIMRIPSDISTLVGVGSSICGGSAIAATAPVIGADDDEVAQAISVIFFFNILAAVLFPILGSLVGFSTTDGEAFGIFAGTAVNDTSSVTAAAASWDSMWGLGTQTLDKAVTVKLTRTLAIIPITLVLSLMQAKKETKKESSTKKFNFWKAFPVFIIFFVAAAVVTTVAVNAGVPAETFNPLKELSKFCIVMSMAAIGLNSNVIKLIKSGGKPIVLGGMCWAGITAVSLLMQKIMGIW